MASIIHMLMFNLFHFLGPGDQGIPQVFWFVALAVIIAAAYYMRNRENSVT